MGKALEWLGPQGCDSVARQILGSAVDEHKSTVEVWAVCPFHADKNPSFRYTPGADFFYCYGCGEQGDLIEMFCRLTGLSESDGFRQFMERYAPEQVNASAPRRTPAESAPDATPAPRVWTPREVDLPPAAWSERAASFIEHAVDRLQADPVRLEQLTRWGINAETARLCRIGWNDKDKYPPRKAWGLPEELNDRGKPRKLWLPPGLVIPFFHDGKPVKIKIRRENPQDGPQGLAHLRYYAVRGGSTRLSVYGNPHWKIWAIVETERDGALVWQEGRPHRIGCIATGSASARPDRYAAAVLARADVILVALDNDAAGRKATHEFWLKEFPAAIRTPIPPRVGKDVGDAPGAGLSVSRWLLASLPSHVRARMSAPAPAPSPAPAADPAPAPAPTPAPVDPAEAKRLEVREFMAQWPGLAEDYARVMDRIRAEGVAVARCGKRIVLHFQDQSRAGSDCAALMDLKISFFDPRDYGGSRVSVNDVVACWYWDDLPVVQERGGCFVRVRGGRA